MTQAGDRRGRRGRASAQLPGRHSRQRRRHDRHGPEGLRAGARQSIPRPDTRHRIEHCSLVNPDLLRRIKALGAIPTPFWTYAHYHGEKWKEYGPEKMQWMFAHKSFLETGIPVPGASDYGPGPFEPLMAIQSMVTRKDYNGNVWGPRQRVTVDEALTIATDHGAYASHEEHVKGSITAGKLADFVMLEKRPARRRPRCDQGDQGRPHSGRRPDGLSPRVSPSHGSKVPRSTQPPPQVQRPRSTAAQLNNCGTVDPCFSAASSLGLCRYRP